MSDNLSRLKFASVEPPPLVWEKIERRLNSEATSNELSPFEKLKDISIPPPTDLRDRLFAGLGDLNETDKLLQPAYQIKRNRKKRVGFLPVSSLMSRKKIYWSMTGIIVASAVLCFYFILSSGEGDRIEAPTTNKPDKNEPTSFKTSSVSDKSGDYLSF